MKITKYTHITNYLE